MSDEFELPAELQPPMANGEVVFEAPWQSRVFGMAVALSEQGCFSWAEFQQQLIHFVGVWDKQSDPSTYKYFEHFSNALMATLQNKEMLDSKELEGLVEVLRERPHGHDHDH